MRKASTNPSPTFWGSHEEKLAPKAEKKERKKKEKPSRRRVKVLVQSAVRCRVTESVCSVLLSLFPEQEISSGTRHDRREIYENLISSRG